MDLEPPKAFLADSLCLGVHKYSTLQVVSHMVEMWRDRVHSASEVAVMWEVKLPTVAETLSDLESQQEGATKTMGFTIELVLLQ